MTHWFYSTKIKYLVTTAIVLECLSTSFVHLAKAEDKSPERLREEENRTFGIEGLRKEHYTRIVPTGKNQRIGFFYSIQPDCSSNGDTEVRITKEPEHGKADVSALLTFPNFPKENIRSKCNEQKVHGIQVTFKSNDKFTGEDSLELLVLYPGGFAWEIDYSIKVR